MEGGREKEEQQERARIEQGRAAVRKQSRGISSGCSLLFCVCVCVRV